MSSYARTTILGAGASNDRIVYGKTEAIMNQASMDHIQRFLRGVDYPASKENLLSAVTNMGADEDVRSSLERLPPQEYQTPDEVGHALVDLPNPPSGQPLSTTASDAQFLAQALRDSMAEIELCAMALDKSSNDDVKQFAKKMIDDHNRIGQEIEQLAAMRDDFDLPRKENAEQSAKKRDLSALSGPEFDKKFMEHNVKDHEKDIKVFSHYAEHLADAELREFAQRCVGILRGHYEMSRQVRDKLPQ